MEEVARGYKLADRACEKRCEDEDAPLETSLEYPRPVEIYAASNGYVLKIGCSYFVMEGDAAKISSELQRYLSKDPNIQKEYHRTEPVMSEDEAKKWIKKVAPAFPPAFDFVGDNLKPCFVRYQVHNGIIDVDFKSRQVKVIQEKYI